MSATVDLARLRRLPSFDGWRAVSIFMVLIAHSEASSGFPLSSAKPVLNFIGGDLGVKFFFVISGFLITWLMLSESERTGSVSLKNFYIRRAIRILPVSIGFLVVLFLLQLLTPFHQTWGDWVANFTFTTNYVPVPWVTNHFWSLAVEEQFYLVWPVLFVVLGLTFSVKRRIQVLLIPLVIAPVFRMVAFLHYYPESFKFLFGHSSFFRYFDLLSLGCLCAVLVARHEQILRNFFRKYFYLIPFVAILMLCEPMFLHALNVPGRIPTAIDYSFQAAGFSLLLIQSVFNPNAAGYRWLNWRVIRYLGVISYSLYIWQELFASDPAIFGWGNAWWKSFPEWWVAAIAAALLSYYGLELPFQNIRARFREDKEVKPPTQKESRVEPVQQR